MANEREIAAGGIDSTTRGHPTVTVETTARATKPAGTAARSSKAKADPSLGNDFDALPDGQRVISAWLRKAQQEAQDVARRTAEQWALNPVGAGFGASLSLQQNLDFMAATRWSEWPGHDPLPSFTCLCDWHGDAALPTLEPLLERRKGERAFKLGLRLVASFRSSLAQDLLLRHLDQPEVRDLVAERARQWPRDSLLRLLALNPRLGDPVADLVLRLLEATPDWLAALQQHLATQASAQALRQTLDRLLAATQAAPDAAPEATAEELPPLLREPPWAKGASPAQVPALALMPLRDPLVLHGPLDPAVAGVMPTPWPDQPNTWEDSAHRPLVPWVEAQIRRELASAQWLPYQGRTPLFAPDFQQRIGAALTHWSAAHMSLYALGVAEDRLDAVLAAESVQSTDFDPQAPAFRLSRFGLLGALSDALALSMWTAKPVSYWSEKPGSYEVREAFMAWLPRFQGRHAEPFLSLLPLQFKPGDLPLYRLIEWDALAARISREGFKSRYTRPIALQALALHPHAAARALIPLVLGTDEAEQGHARYHLQRLVALGQRACIERQGARYGTEAVQALAQWLSLPSERLLPAKLPTLPKWITLSTLPRLILKQGGAALPQRALPDVLMIMALCKAGMAYPGMAQLQMALVPESLSRFMLALFDQWEDNGCPAKDRWIFELQGLMGNDATARHLVPRIRQWRQALIRQRAYEGLEMLVQIGSDSALMLLHGFTQQKRFSDLAERATKAMTVVAEQRGLTLEELADRTVPTLGLDARGERSLSFGARKFTLSVDAGFGPRVVDGSGRRLKDLPKPGAQDDEVQAQAAAAEYKEFKKQLKLIGSAQVVRLEAAMCMQRRWSAEDFQQFFVAHPLMRHFSQRVLWAVFDAQGQWQADFRVAEDGSLADAEDDLFVLASDAMAKDAFPTEPGVAPDTERSAPALHIGLPHPLELPQGTQARWAQALTDYEILPIFEQLNRQTFGLGAAELEQAELSAYAGRRVGTGSLLGLEGRGWKRHTGESGNGTIDHFIKALPGSREAVLSFDNGWYIAGAPPAAESHCITRIHLQPVHRYDGSSTSEVCTWAQLNPMTLSELLRDLERMAWHSSV